MADQRLRIRNFSGGLSQDDKFGPDNSFGQGQSVDFRQKQGGMGLLQRLQRENDITEVKASIDGTTKYASTTASNMNFAAEDFEISARIAPTVWATGTTRQTIISKGHPSSLNAQWDLILESTGALILATTSTTGSSLVVSTVIVPVADAHAAWVRATYRDSDRRVQFFIAPDSPNPPTSWTQLGTDLTEPFHVHISASTAVNIGRDDSGNLTYAGYIYRVMVRRGINGALVGDFNPTDSSGAGDTSWVAALTNETWTASTSGVVVSTTFSPFTAPPNDAARTPDGSIYIVTANELVVRSPGFNGAVGDYSVVDVLGAGEDIIYDDSLDTLFIFSNDQLAITTYGPIANSPVLNHNKFFVYPFINNFANAGGTYSLPTAISEAANDTFPFTATGDSFDRIDLKVSTKGTGDWTFTVHDAANTVIWSQTGPNASIPTSGQLILEPNNPVRLKLGSDYHFHITVSAGTSAVFTDTTNELPGVAIDIYTPRLVASNYGHIPMFFGADLYFCNGRYLGQWEILNMADNATDGYNPYQLEFPPGCDSCGLALYSEYIAVATAVSESSDTLSLGGTRGIIFFYDGVSSSYTFALDVPEGVPESLYAYRNALYWIADGTLYTWAGDQIQPVYRFPGMDDFDGGLPNAPNVDVYLHAPRHGITNERGLLHVGFPGLTANVNIEYGIWSYGTARSGMPNAVSKDYVLSTGVETVNFQTQTPPTPDIPITSITLVKQFGDTLLVAWKDILDDGSIVFGMDYRNALSLFATAANWRSLQFDNADSDIEKTPKALKITFTPLPANSTLTPIVNYDRSDTDIFGVDGDGNTIQAVEGDIDVVFPLDANDGFYEAEFGFDYTGDGLNDILVTSINFKYDDNRNNALATENRRGVV